MIRKIFFLLLILFLAIQFIRPARNNGVAESATDITHFVRTPDTVLHILKTSCYDCHSNRTEYPWYVNVNPVGLWLRSHINDGKRAINFSDLSGFTKKKLDHRFGDIADEVEKGDMPLSTYTFIHRYASLDSGQIKLIKDWTIAVRKEINYQE
jgi:Haem-binding domain